MQLRYKKILKIRRSALTLAVIISAIFLAVKCTSDSANTTKTEQEDKFKEFAGSTACVRCHKDVYDSYTHTGHYFSSSPATEKTILGSFENGKNEFDFNEFIAVDMEKRDSAFYQVEYINGAEAKRGRLDISIGSGKKGQTYLSWAGNHLVQLPISYFSPARQWSNSPGFPVDQAVFNRAITSRCLECHMTYVQKISDTAIALEEFDHNRILYAVNCEKCHGPAARHVEFQTQNPEIKQAKFIINPAKLSRQQKLDLCALCHGGQLNKTKPSFTFQAGDTLADFFSINKIPVDPAAIDVHGNQMGLLVASKCFQMSELTCTSCHDIHKKENGQIASFSRRCMNCHNEAHGTSCKMTASIGPVITEDCIDCHMPKQPSHSVAVYLQGMNIPVLALMRTHFIKVYPEQTEPVLNMLREKKLQK